MRPKGMGSIHYIYHMHLSGTIIVRHSVRFQGSTGMPPTGVPDPASVPFACATV